MTSQARPFRVTMVNKYYYPPHMGGVETVVRTLADGLVDHAGAHVRALVSNESPESVCDRVGEVEVLRLPRHFRLSSAPVALGMRRALRNEMRRESQGVQRPPDVIHLHSPYPWGELCFLSAGLDVPSVVYYHSDIVRQKLMLSLYRPFLERFLDRVDLIMTSSPNMITNSELLAPRAERCRVVPFGLPLDKIAYSPDIARCAHELRARHENRKIVLFVGRLVYYKGVDVLLRAMVGIDADLVLVGDGPLETSLRRLAADLGIASHVCFLPALRDEELHAWYGAADVFCLPSVARSEAFGLVQLEAHAAGTPVVSTNLSTGVPYVNLDGETGIVVPPGDAPALHRALTQLLSDNDLRLHLGRQARERALRDFTVTRMVENTLAVYAEAVELHAATSSDTVRHGSPKGAS